MSASKRPTELVFDSARAKFVATVLLPTPPLPELTAMMCFTPGIAYCWSKGLGGDWRGGCEAGRVSRFDTVFETLFEIFVIFTVLTSFNVLDCLSFIVNSVENRIFDKGACF